jgi:microcystin-dependent protein
MPLILPNDIANEQFADGDKLQQNFTTIEDWANQEAISRDGSTAMTGALLLPGPPTQPDQAATKAYVDSTGLIGEIKMYGGDTEPANWMFCRGQAVSRATYAALFGVYGTKYGAGDGSTTFNLPSFIGRMPIGMYPGGGWANAMGQMGGSQNATLPTHIHGMEQHIHGGETGDDAPDHFHFGYGGVQQFLYADPGFTSGSAAVPGGLGLFQHNGTGWASTRHRHPFSTGGATGHNTLAAGSDPANANLPPYTTINFIVKVQ